MFILQRFSRINFNKKDAIIQKLLSDKVHSGSYSSVWCVLWSTKFQELIRTEGCGELKESLEKGFSNALLVDLVTDRAPCLGAGFGGSRRQNPKQSVNKMSSIVVHIPHLLYL